MTKRRALHPLPPSIAPALYAWVGLDEHDASKGIGLKQAGAIGADGRPIYYPLVYTEQHRDRAERCRPPLHEQAIQYERTIRLVKYVAVEVIEELS